MLARWCKRSRGNGRAQIAAHPAGRVSRSPVACFSGWSCLLWLRQPRLARRHTRFPRIRSMTRSG